MHLTNKLKVLCHKRHLFTRTQYLATVDSQHLLICKLKDSAKPKHSVTLEWDTVITWQVDKKGQLEAFGIRDIKNEVTWFFSAHTELQILRKLLSCQVTFAYVTDFYNPLRKISTPKRWKFYEVAKHGDNTKTYTAKFIQKQDLDTISDTLAFSNGHCALLKYFSIITLLDHENFIKIHEIFQGDSRYYVIMDFVNGRTLTQLLREERYLSLKNIINIIHQALQGLDYLHSKEIIHLNISPDKLFCAHYEGDWPGKLKILGFRNAIRKDQEFAHAGLLGKPGYIAPELLQEAISLNCSVTQKCDIFSLGAVFFKLLTQKELFKGSSAAEILLANKNAEMNWAAFDYNKVPLQIISLIEAMLWTNPEKRISANDALKNYFKDESLQFRSQSHFMYQQMSQNKGTAYTSSVYENEWHQEYFSNELPPKNTIPILTAFSSKQTMESDFDTELPERAIIPVTIFGTKK